MKRRRRAQLPPSGRFVLRVSPGLHAALRHAAATAGSSLNDYCTRKLAAPVGNVTGLGAASAVVERAADVVGAALVGVVVYGSWARGEANDRSDVDVLIVVDGAVSITRGLYRTWDTAPMTWEGRPVEAHFVRLPETGERIGGVWAEAAIDGIVLFERGVLVSARLAAVRRAIFAGRLVRRFAHGQPYWSEVA